MAVSRVDKQQSITIRNERDIDRLSALLRARKLPVTVSIAKGKKRSNASNRLQRMWLNEAAEQLQDETAEGYRGYCKLHFGVPILRAENEAFRDAYDRLIRPRPYEEKLELMQVPLDFPCTRLMSSEQMSRYLNAQYQHFRSLGVVLTEPPSDWGWH